MGLKFTLASYLLYCAGVGALFGAHGWPLFWNFFYFPLWAVGAVLVALAYVAYEISLALHKQGM